MNTKLSKEESHYISIPNSLILNTGLYPERISLYCWFRINSKIKFSFEFEFNWIDYNNKDNQINIKDDIERAFKSSPKVIYNKKHLCQWLGSNPLSRKNDVNPIDRVEAILKTFKSVGILNNVEHIKYNTYHATFKEIEEDKFVKIYPDEINKIINTQSEIYPKLNKSMVILVLAYLRIKIPQNNSNKMYFNESYNTFYKLIGEDVGIDERQVKKSIEFLSELGIIHCEDYTYISGSFKLTTHIFTNTYKRDTVNGVLVTSGKDYYEPIVETKKRFLDKYFKKCIINGENITEELLNENAT